MKTGEDVKCGKKPKADYESQIPYDGSPTFSYLGM